MERTQVLLVHGRQLSESITDNPTFKWSILAIGGVVGIIVVAGIIALFVWKCGRVSSDKVVPDQAGKDVEIAKGTDFPSKPAAWATPDTQPAAAAESQHSGEVQFRLGSQPPWEQYGLAPPGIMLAPALPTSFVPFVSNPRPSVAPPYERLVLVSSRVHQPMQVVKAALPEVAVVCYDWKAFTLQELLRYIKKALGPGAKVTSIAVIAPGSRPGSIALLEGCETSVDKLAGGGELAQFWRVLAGCVAANEAAEGRRVDLLGCRVVEAPREGAALLKALWNLTAVPFAAADDALGGYQLSTFIEEPVSGVLSIIASTIHGIDLYFNRYALLGIEPPGLASPGEGLTLPLPSTQHVPPLPPGPVPPSALQAAGGPASSHATGAPAAAPGPASSQVARVLEARGAAGLAPTHPRDTLTAAGPASDQARSTAAVGALEVAKDIFTRFMHAVTQMQSKPAAIFNKYDKDRSGWLSQDEVVRLVMEVVPGASALDAAHLRCMLDLDGNQQVTLAEFCAALDDGKAIAATVRAGRDDTSLMATLTTYLSDNDAVLRQYFLEADANKTGRLEHEEVAALVAQIPGLIPVEQKFIISYLYQVDPSGRGSLSLDGLKAAIRGFGSPAAQATLAAPPPLLQKPVPEPTARAHVELTAHSGQQAQVTAAHQQGHTSQQAAHALSMQQQQPGYASQAKAQQQEAADNTLPLKQLQQQPPSNASLTQQQQQVLVNAVPMQQQQQNQGSAMPMQHQQQQVLGNAVPMQQQQQKQGSVLPMQQQQQQILGNTLPIQQQQQQTPGGAMPMQQQQPLPGNSWGSQQQLVPGNAVSGHQQLMPGAASSQQQAGASTTHYQTTPPQPWQQQAPAAMTEIIPSSAAPAPSPAQPMQAAPGLMPVAFPPRAAALLPPPSSGLRPGQLLAPLRNNALPQA